MVGPNSRWRRYESTGLRDRRHLGGWGGLKPHLVPVIEVRATCVSQVCVLGVCELAGQVGKNATSYTHFP